MGAETRGEVVPEQGQETEVTRSALMTSALLTRLERDGAAAGQTRGTRGGDRSSAAGVPAGAYPGVPRWIARLLRISLPLKLAGANAFLLIAAAAAALIVRSHEISSAPVIAVLSVALLTALVVNIALVTLAVRPITLLEQTVDELWRGNLHARVPGSLLADRHLARVARMFNILLDGLVADRTRTRRLAVELINAGDRERAAISRELHDSTAQSLAALVMQLSVVARTADEIPRELLKERLEGTKLLATATLEEVRLLAHTMHPRVLDDLGLVAALRRLARETTSHAASQGGAEGGDGMLVDVVALEGCDDVITPEAASVLYRVAQEAVQNARRHAAPKHIEIRVWTDRDTAMLEITDDGTGFDPEAARPSHGGIGLFTMRERVALVDGGLRITSRPGGGTSVVASIPLREPRSAPLNMSADK
jgi:signal transduction histidine kinase